MSESPMTYIRCQSHVILGLVISELRPSRSYPQTRNIILWEHSVIPSSQPRHYSTERVGRFPDPCILRAFEVTLSTHSCNPPIRHYVLQYHTEKDLSSEIYMINATEISITHTPSPMPTTIPVRKALPSASITGSNLILYPLSESTYRVYTRVKGLSSTFAKKIFNYFRQLGGSLGLAAMAAEDS